MGEGWGWGGRGGLTVIDYLCRYTRLPWGEKGTGNGGRQGWGWRLGAGDWRRK